MSDYSLVLRVDCGTRQLSLSELPDLYVSTKFEVHRVTGIRANLGNGTLR